jgi:hypothetical protein
MTIERLRELYRAEPFHPFTICLADGQRLEIPHREFIAWEPQGRTVSVFQPDNSHHFIDLLLVTDLVRNQPESANRENGHH